MEKTVKSDLKVTVILSLADADSNFPAYESLLLTINKSKTDAECIVLDSSSNQKHITKLNADKSFTELQTKGKLKLLKVEGALGKQYAQALQSAEGSVSLLIEKAARVNVQALLSWVSSNKKAVKEGVLNVGSYGLKTANTKTGRSLTDKLYNSFVRFLTPLDLRDHSSGIMAVRTESAVPLFEKELAAAGSHLEILHFATCNGVGLDEFALSTEKKDPVKGLFDIILLPFTAILLRFKYFIPGALHEMKQPGQTMVNSNHPLYRMIFFILVIGSTIAMPYLSQDYGMTWDEKQHNDYSQLAYNWFATFGEDSSAIIDAKGNADFIRQCYRFYGEQSNAVAAIVYNVFDTPPFETRHFIISLYGLLGLISIGMAAKELGGWRAGIIAILFVLFNPGWLGNSMNNPTDIPLAAGFAFSLYFFIKVLKRLPKPKQSHLVWLGIAIGVGIAARIGAFLLIAYFALFLGVNWLTKFREKDVNPGKLIWPYAKIFLTVAVLGYFFGILLWPYALTGPLTKPFEAFVKASDNTSFYTNNTELFDGKRLFMREQAPWYYVIRFLSFGNPVYLLLGLLLPVLLFRWMKDKIGAGFLALLFFMTLFPVAYAEYANLNYYNGWRHYLFVLPAWITLAAVSFNYLFGLGNKAIRFVSLAVLLVLFIRPAIWIVQNHPNQYVYFNELAGGMKGAYGKYELDYYSNSCRAAGEWIAEQEKGKKIVVAINNEPLTASYYAKQISPEIEFQWVREYEEDKSRWDYMILTTRTFSSNELLNGSFPPKGTVHTIDVDGVPIAAIIKRQNYFMPQGYEAVRAQKFDSAVYFFGKAVEWDPKSEEAHRMLGAAYMNLNRFDEAEREFKKAIEIYPENFSAYSILSSLYYSKRDFNKCIENADIAVKYKENTTEAYYYAALSYMNLNQPFPAIERLEKALTHGGQVPEFYYYLGRAYDMTNNYEKSAGAYEACLSLNQNLVPAWNDLANAYTKLGMTQQAQQAMQRFQQLGGR